MSDGKDLLKRVDRLDLAMWGTKPDGSDGVRAIVTMQNHTLYGTPSDPGGIEKAVKNLTRTLWICTGAFIAFEIFTRVLPMIAKLKGTL